VIQTEAGDQREAWLRDARQSELQRLFAYVVLSATLFFGQVTVWGVLLAQRGHLPTVTPVLVFVGATDFLLAAFGLAAITRYDLVSRLEQELRYPEAVIALLRAQRVTPAGWVAQRFLMSEYVLFGTQPTSLGARGWWHAALAWVSGRRVVLPLIGLAMAVGGMTWLIAQLYWPWLVAGTP
jgi:hypothetical protein